MDELEKLKAKLDARQARVKELGRQRLAANDKIDAFFEALKTAGVKDLTDDQEKQHAELVAAFDALGVELEKEKTAMARAEALYREQELAATADENLERLTVPGQYRKTKPDQPAAAPSAARVDNKGRVTSSFEETNEIVTLRFGEDRTAQTRQSYRQVRDQNRQLLKSSGYAPWNEFASVNDFVRAGLNGAGSDRFEARVNKHYAAVHGMNESVGAEGGYTVMPEFSSRILDRVYSNPLWGRTDNYPVVGNNIKFLANAETSRANGSRHGGLRGYWVGEGGTFTASKPTFRKVDLSLVKLGVVVYLTEELISDSGTALEEYVARKASEEFNFMIGDALINGTGVGQPLGVLNAPSLVSVAKETGQGAATIQVENIEKMYTRFYMPNMGGAYWYHNQDILPQLDLMTLGIGAAGVPVYLPPGGVSAAPYGTMKGRPLDPIEFAATLGTQGDLVLADLGQILSISKGGIAQAVSMHVQFLTSELAIRFIMRLNAQPWENAAITPYKGSATQSSFVALDTRA